MFDLSNITQSNGWAISILGITIVFIGLVLLAFAISQLHKLLALWDHRDTFWERWRPFGRPEPAAPPEAPHPPFQEISPSLRETARQFKLLADFLGQPFALPDILELAHSRGVHRPHHSLYQMLEHQLIRPDGKGYFLWNQERFDAHEKHRRS